MIEIMLVDELAKLLDDYCAEKVQLENDLINYMELETKTRNKLNRICALIPHLSFVFNSLKNNLEG